MNHNEQKFVPRYRQIIAHTIEIFLLLVITEKLMGGL
jgi:hypothetical protein